MADEPGRIITGLSIKSKNKECTITFDNKIELECSVDLVIKNNLSKGQKISERLFETIKQEQRIIEVKRAAYNFASYRTRTKRQVVDKLKTKKFTMDEIFTALNFLREFDLLDDAKFAKSYIESVIKRKAVSELKIFSSLKAKGLDKFTIEDAIKKYFPSDKKVETAIVAAKKKMKMLTNKDLAKTKRTLTTFLERQGFEWDIIKQALNEIFPKNGTEEIEISE